MLAAPRRDDFHSTGADRYRSIGCLACQPWSSWGSVTVFWFSNGTDGCEQVDLGLDAGELGGLEQGVERRGHQVSGVRTGRRAQEGSVMRDSSGYSPRLLGQHEPVQICGHYLL